MSSSEQPKEQHSLEGYLKICSDREYSEYIIATMTQGDSPLGFDKIQREAIQAVRSRPHPAPEVNRNKDGKLTLTYDEYSLAEHDAAIARKAREDAETTDNILAVMKKRYRAEMAILDYIEMIECEVIALRAQQAGDGK